MPKATKQSGSRRRLVVSAVNFTEGGPLTVLQNFLRAASETLSEEWQIVAFVHDHRVVSMERVIAIEIPYTKHSWFRRIWFEWYESRRYSNSLLPSLWVSLHDISPNVGRVRQVVYCHNPAPFFSIRIRDAFLEPSLLLFRFGYQWLYRFNIRKNYAVIVQQAWLRTHFRQWVDTDAKILVAHPSEPSSPGSQRVTKESIRDVSFFYPALPRAFKNVELLCCAAQRLESEGPWSGKILLTIDGTENRYARWLTKRYGNLNSVKFIGRQSQEAMLARYAEADCLLFPSRLETWGLPISEAKQRGLPMFIADLPYARETVGTYDRVDFIDVNDHVALADKLKAFQRGEFQFQGARTEAPGPPFVSGWESLIKVLTNDID
jgi:glycosyltransferase involved in cell wall biosynthesis